jgi:hypothetical protein
VVDIAHQGQTAATRLYTCDDGSGTFTMVVTGYLAEHVSGGAGGWRISEGTGAYVNLRGFGKWTSEPLSGDNQPFRATLTGIADLDTSAPVIAISRASATKLRSPAGAYRLRVAFTARDNVDGNIVSYRVVVSVGLKSWSRAGRTATGAAVTLLVRPPKSVRRLLLAISATDPLGNERRTTRSLKL